MKIKVLRDYCGEEGEDVDKNVFAGTTHVVTRQRAEALKANGLAEIVGDDAHPDDEKEPEVESGEKKIEPIANKKAAEHPNKAAAKPAAKPKADAK